MLLCSFFRRFRLRSLFRPISSYGSVFFSFLCFVLLVPCTKWRLSSIHIGDRVRHAAQRVSRCFHARLLSKSSDRSPDLLWGYYFDVSILTGFLLSISNWTRVLCCFCLRFDTERGHVSRARRTMRANERVLRKKPDEKRGCWRRWIVTRVTPADDWFFERVVCLFRWNASRLLSNGFYHEFVEIFSLFRCYVFFEFFKFPGLGRVCICICISLSLFFPRWKLPPSGSLVSWTFIDLSFFSKSYLVGPVMEFLPTK